MTIRLAKPGDPDRDVWQLERRAEVESDGQWNRAVSIDVDGFADCCDFAIRYPALWATIVQWRVLLRLGSTLHETGSGILPIAGPGVLALGGDISALIHKVRGIPHDGLIIELRVPVLAAARGVATVHGKSWARSPADLSVGKVNIDVPQPLQVLGTVAIAPQPVEVLGTVAIAPQPVEVFGLVSVAEPVTVEGAVSILGQPLQVLGTVEAVPPVANLDRFNPPALPGRVVLPAATIVLVDGFSIWNGTTQPIFFMTWDAGAIPVAGTPSNTAPIRVAAGTNVSVEFPPIRYTNGLTWGASSVSTGYTNIPGPNQPLLLVDTFWR
jgi:hypothetical protein